jgi:indolepyruvate ferredoxin oxidoreductase beta subunit
MTDDGEFSLLMCGVGGQGLVMLSQIIGSACADSGLRVITGEQHGLSQRSGTISIHLRIGNGVRSPLIPAGSGDALLSLEALEALRYVEYLKEGGIAISSSRIMHPVSESGEMLGNKTKTYFGLDEIESRLRRVTGNVMFIDALSIANDAGNPLAENVAVLGALSVLMSFPVPADGLRKAISKVVPPKAKDDNLRAFGMGAKVSHERFCKIIPCRDI